VLSVLLVSVLLVDAALLSVLPELLELSVTPIAESALAIALAKPPPPPGGGGGGPSGIPLVPLALVLLELPLKRLRKLSCAAAVLDVSELIDMIFSFR